MDWTNYIIQIDKFVEELKSEFDNNFKKKLKGISGNVIIRGTNPSLSNVVEDKFAEFLNRIYFDRNYLFLVDVNLSTKSLGEGKSIRPDIVVINREKNEIVALFELKIDDARASDNWVESSQEKLDWLKEISTNVYNQYGNYIRYTTLRLNDDGEPEKTKSGRYSTVRHSITCSPYAKVACIALCQENSRKKENTDMLRTTGKYALYLSKKHFNNQNHTLNDILEETNLRRKELYKILIELDL